MYYTDQWLKDLRKQLQSSPFIMCYQHSLVVLLKDKKSLQGYFEKPHENHVKNERK